MKSQQHGSEKERTAKSISTHVTWVRKYFEETKQRLGERYHQILKILDQNTEGDM